MRLQPSEIRARLAAFAERHRDAHYEKGETHTFYNEFFECFGVDRKQVAAYEHRVRNLPGDKQGFIDLFWPGTLIVEQKSAGLDLKRASDQALDYFDWLPEGQRPRYILTCDFQRWHLLDLEEGREWQFALADLKDRIDAFSFILGEVPKLNRRQSPANEKATRLMGQLHERLAESGYEGHDLEVLLVRLLFILFADDTRIFNNKDQFQDFLERRTSPDGRDLGRWLGELFDVLNTPTEPVNRRQTTLDPDLAAFPYINGNLFAERIEIAAFDNAMRDLLLEACEFEWGEVSPAIFGSLFESVIDKVTRRKQGAHYTPEDAILKLIGPLFLDELRAEFERAKALRSGRDEALKRLHDRLAGLTFLDPACGAGNFLVIAYRELRELERELVKERFLRPGMTRPRLSSDAALFSRINVDQFFGIEIDEFPARIAEVALWMTDHIANVRLGEDFGEAYARIPLVSSPGIRHGDALEIDWNEVLPAESCSYVLGNPPFAGKKEQSPEQKRQVRAVFRNARGAGDLDYVTAWYEKAALYSASNREMRCAFVSTNSITQGEQVAYLWSRMLGLHGMRIAFAHRTFEWRSPSRYAAHVHVVIIGFQRRDPTKRRLFDYPNPRGSPVELAATNINAYLMDYRNVFVEKVEHPLSARPRMTKGSEATDFGFLTVKASDRLAVLNSPGFNNEWLRRFVGGKEFINDIPRFCLWLVNAESGQLRRCDIVMKRLEQVAQKRAESDKPRTQAWSSQPSLFSENRQPEGDYLLIPKVSSSHREYIPLGFATSDVIVSGSAQYINGRDLFAFGVLTSAMHMAWLRTVGGRTKSDYQYTIGLVYNTFPWPNATSAQRKKIEALAQAVLDARALPRNATSTLADIYDVRTMPAELRKAHRDLDAAVDKLYRARPFASDRERVEHLFPLYEALVHPTAAAPAANRRAARRAREVERG